MAIEFIETLIRINLALAAGVAIVMALRIPARRLFGARVAYALWVLPLIAAAMCFVPGRIEHIVLEAPAVSPALSVSSAPEPPYLLWAWASGALLCLAVLALRQFQFTRALGRLAAREDMGPDVRSAQTTTHGPAVLGVIRPLIITPADFETRFDAEEQRIVLAHERAHLAQGDPWINAIMLAVQCVNWFNPFVHIAARALRMDQELACDASVLEREGALRRRYAEAMLKTHISATAPLGCAWPPANLDALKERISMLKRALPSRTQRLLGATAIVAATAATAAVAWAAQPTRIVTTFEEREVTRHVDQHVDEDFDLNIDINADSDVDFEGGDYHRDETRITINADDRNDRGRRIVIRNGEVIEDRELTPEEREEARRAGEEGRRAAAEAREVAREAREAAREAAAEGREAAREAREAAREAVRHVQVHQLTAEERAEIREAVREAREAIAEVEVHEFSEADRAQVRAALDQARVAVDQARIQAEVSAATREQVRAAMATARAEMERSRVVLANLEPMDETLAEIAADLREEAAEARAEGARERAAEMDRAAEQLERRAEQHRRRR